MSKFTAVPATNTIACYYTGRIGNRKIGFKDLWHARHPEYPGIVGAGNSAHNAIRDFRACLRVRQQNGLKLQVA